MKSFFLAVSLLAALTAPAAAQAADRPSPGAAGLGDRLFPTLGNGGYDVQHYDVALNYATAAPSQPIDGTVTITAKATKALSRFDLDFAGDSVGSISVDDAPATFRRSGQELVITPKQSLAKGKPFTVVVANYKASPKRPSSTNVLNNAFVMTADGSATLPQPAQAHVFLPSNDHPRDKATFTFRLDVPDGETAVASGDLESQTSANGRTTFVYQQQQPLATELIQLAVGRYKVIDRGIQDGVHVRDLVAPGLEAKVADELPVEIEQLKWLKDRLGAYPFGTYGSLVIDAPIGASLETQTLSIFTGNVFDQPANVVDYCCEPSTTQLHEAVHQWFGNSVSPREWSDVWLNEGHARYYEWVYDDEQHDVRKALGVADTFDGVAKYSYSYGDYYREVMQPVARPKGSDFKSLFAEQSYSGGALVLYALRQKVGEKTFEKIEREWLTRYAGTSASTADYIALASRVSGKQLGPFLHDWLYGSKTPAMPGHPDWKVIPAKRVTRGKPGTQG